MTGVQTCALPIFVQVQAVLALMREPGLAALDDGDWRRLAAATLRGGLQALGGR